MEKKTLDLPVLGKKDYEIILILFEASRPLSIQEIADRAEISWITAKKHLELVELLKLFDIKDNKYVFKEDARKEMADRIELAKIKFFEN